MYPERQRPPQSTQRTVQNRRNMQLSSSLASLLFLFLAVLPTIVRAHGFLDKPACRGGLNCKRCSEIVSRTAPTDYYLHFPAGDKSVVRGAGFRSQIRAAGGRWTPFEPMKPGFRWRAGVCGDLRNPANPRKGDHMPGGKYYWPPEGPQIVEKFRPGSVFNASIKIVAHHNGYMEFHLCDVAKCRFGDINEQCFLKHCRQLKRAPNAKCDNGYSRNCGPIDKKYPGRWYFPCSKNFDDGVWETYGQNGSIQYIIPEDFQCERCVLHWFWTAANTCNPPGVIEYFDGEDRPKNWGQCLGQGGARGGVTRVQPPCGRNPNRPRQPQRFPEEYYQCADVSVLGPPVRRGENPVRANRPKPAKKKNPPRSQPDDRNRSEYRNPRQLKLKKKTSTGNLHGSGGLLTGLQLVSRGVALGSIHHGDELDISGLDELTFQIDAKPEVEVVKFTVSDGAEKWVKTETAKPFRMYTGDDPEYWLDEKDVKRVTNKALRISVETVLSKSGHGDRDEYWIKLLAN